MGEYGLLLAWWLAALYQTANGIVAVRSPAKWLGASWTTTMGFNRSLPPSEYECGRVRSFGILTLATAAFLIAISCKATFDEFF
jgi:hypothetical protein